MYVVQYEMQPRSAGLREPPAKAVASLNTHDMPTFQAFWQAKDVDDLQSRVDDLDQAAQSNTDTTETDTTPSP